ncbi:MAG: hypothetical protein U1A78_10130 [Polyangia bacterium]
MQLVSWADLAIAGLLWLLGLQYFRNAGLRRRRRAQSSEPARRGDPGALIVSGVGALMVALGLFVIAISLVMGALIG